LEEHGQGGPPAAVEPWPEQLCAHARPRTDRGPRWSVPGPATSAQDQVATHGSRGLGEAAGPAWGVGGPPSTPTARWSPTPTGG